VGGKHYLLADNLTNVNSQDQNYHKVNYIYKKAYLLKDYSR